LEKTQTTIHEPYYNLEISLPERYLGNILEELQRIKGEISNVVTRGKEATIEAILPVRTGIRIADNFRHLTDGNVFWSFPSVEFLPVF
jgi:translation elongation factor EF-G